MGSTYFTTTPQSIVKTSTMLQKPTAFVMVLLTVLSSLLFSLFAIVFTSQQQSAQAFDPVNYIACQFGNGSLPHLLEEFRTTDKLKFELRSKSVVTPGLSDVDTMLGNTILSATGADFAGVNETILGFAVDGSDSQKIAEKSEEELAEDFNKGPKVSPYDRFGFAGLNFTNYTGEWRYVYVDVCANTPQPVDMAASEFYEGRLEPRSMWSDIPDSADPRTQQFSLNYQKAFFDGFLNLLANISFWFAKAMTGLTVAFVNFSFSDIISLMKIDELLVGANGNNGLYGALFSSIFFPLIVVAILLTGVKVAYDGFVKRHFRSAIGTAALSIILFLAGIIASVNPAFLVTAPNTAVIALQSVIVTSMNTGLVGGDGICDTDIGSSPKSVTSGANRNSSSSVLHRASTNMASSISCSFWETFTFRPWVQGQWGAHWNDLWMKGNIPDWAPDGARTLQHTNEKMVGDAAVPLGDGEFIHNWAVFQLSAQTNAHAPLEREGQPSLYTMSVANDWWRIVDAVSNYQEQEVSERPVVRDSPVDEISWTEPAPAATAEQWDHWVGNNTGSRIGTGMTASVVAVIGLLAPFLFGLLATVYSIGMAVLLVFAPVMFLFGAWGGKGFQVFKSWGVLLLKVMAFRVVIAILLMLSILFTVAAITIMENIGWWSGVLMMATLAFILVSLRGKIMEILTSVLPQSSMSETASRFSNRTMGTVKGAGTLAVAGAAGGVAAKRRGMSIREGVSIGLKNQVKNFSYRSDMGSMARMVYQDKTGYGSAEKYLDRDRVSEQTCLVCNGPVASEDDTIAYQLQNGLYICAQCAREGKDAELNATPVFLANAGDIRDAKHAEERKQKKKEILSLDRSAVSSKKYQELYEGDNLSKESLSKAISDDLLGDVAKSVQQYQKGERDANTRNPAHVPDELLPFVNEDLIMQAVRTGNFAYVMTQYAAGYVALLSEKMHETIPTEQQADVLDAVLAKLQTDYGDAFKTR